MKRLAFLLLLLASTVLAREVTYCTDDATVMSPCFTITLPETVCPVCPAPLPPPVVTPPPPATSDAALIWDAVAGATGYRVYYGTTSGVYLQPRGAGFSTTATAFTVTGLAPLVRYFFAVTAQNSVGEGPFSNEVFKDIVTSLPPPLVDTTPPSVPTNFTVIPLTSTSIRLTWSPSTDNVAVTGYIIYNAKTGGTITTRVGTTFTHSGLTPGSLHSYRVSAYDAVPNHSPWTEAVTVTTPLQ